MTALVGAAVLIIIAIAVFLFALGVLRREVGRQRARADESMGAQMAVPMQEFSANHPGTTFPFSADGMQSSSGSGLDNLNMEEPWTRMTYQSGRSQDGLVDYSALAFATEPVPTEQMPELSPADATQLPSTPVPQQQAIPSTPTTPTDLWKVPAGEIVTDPTLEAMMHEAQAGLYVILEREDKLEA